MIIIFKVYIAVQAVKAPIVSVEREQGQQQGDDVAGAFEGRDRKPPRCRLVRTRVCCEWAAGGPDSRSGLARAAALGTAWSVLGAGAAAAQRMLS